MASRSAADLETARTKVLEQRKVEVTCHALDLSVSDNVAELARRCANVDVLINNAGAIPSGDLFAVDAQRWRKGWDLKVFGYIDLTRAIYAHMRERRRGAIVNVIGVAGERPRASYIAGTSGNAALMAFSRALGAESVDHGVRVVGVNPGQIDTDRLRWRLEAEAEKKLGDRKRWLELVKNPPMGRLGRPEEIADAVLFLASARASFISGTVVTVDAGRAARNLD
jgi:NAD(P)-dependent dehydrogenase (short-subunit alcohol dehydrogenase family)